MAREQSPNNVSRRTFIKRSAGAALGATVATNAGAQVYKSIFPQTVIGANEKIYTGHIGTGGMGRANLGFVMQRDDMEIVAICDLYRKNLERGAQMASQKFPNITKHHDFREILENKDVDAVVIATPDHWHCLCTLFAADAGKDIYCEKPLSTTIEEGRAMIEAVRRNNVVFQGGNMQRSGAHFQEAVELVRSGYIGQVGSVEAFIQDEETVDGIGMGDDDQAKWEQEGLDWEFHQGWVEHKPFNTNRWIYNFRWFLDYSGGKITDWGAHLIDAALWGMGDAEKQPVSACAMGGKYVVHDNRTTPDTLDVVWEYDTFTLKFTNRVWNQFLPEGFQSHGVLFHGTLGTLRVDRSGYEVYPVKNNGGCEPKKGGATPLNEPHWENFCQCVRERKDPISTVELLHNTTRTCHMGTCSYVAGGRLFWDLETEHFKGDDEVAKKGNAWAYRPYLNGWSLKAPYRTA
ncbi:MAG: Gfo/Idh/MocA family oxidoreductase [Candidatus Hydrogenedentes bacterium]|nr:Gfo/Idh/MocA family oxidoreductase [Candidatus Hydrogenedentota bacterium]